MAFKTMTQYDEERYGGWFLLRNDGDYADVIFLYRNKEDVLIGDVHYIKTPNYSGYVHCTEINCPACEKGIRIQSKLFIPVYNITDGEIQFWDRSIKFENQLVQDVFSKYPNPSEFVFRIQRQGAAGDINTKYNIWAVGKNKLMDYNQILLTNNATMPDYYENICKTYSSTELHSILNKSVNSSTSYESNSMPDYQVTPRVPMNDMDIPDVPDFGVPEVASSIGDDLPEFTSENLSASEDVTDELPPDVNF